MKKTYCCACRRRSWKQHFCIPKNKERREIWAQRTAQPEIVDSEKDLRICDIHFDPSQFESRREDGLRKLKPNAVPMIHPISKNYTNSEKGEIGMLGYQVRKVKLNKGPNIRHISDAEIGGKSYPYVKDSHLCCLCSCLVYPAESVAIFQDSSVVTDFGLVLSSVLKMNIRSLLSRYSCKACCQQIIQCFELIIDLNASAILASRNASIAKALEQGCHQCGIVYPTVEEFTDHFMVHVLQDIKLAQCDIDNNLPSCQSVKHIVQSKEEVKVNDVSNKEASKIEDETLATLKYEGDGKTLVIAEHSYHKIRISKSDGSRVCHLCGKKLSTRFTLLNHIKRHEDPDFPFKRKSQRNPRCKETRPRQSKIENLDTAPLVCELCGLVFSQRFLLVNHKVLMHASNFDELYQKRGRRRAWPCTVCGDMMPAYRILKKHCQEQHRGAGLASCRCELCGKTYKSKSNLRYHIKINHVLHYRYRCDVCGRRFTTEDNLQKHHVLKHWNTPEIYSEGEPLNCEEAHHKKLGEVLIHNLSIDEEAILNIPTKTGYNMN